MGGEEATRMINEIWSLGEEEGYWSEYVLFLEHEFPTMTNFWLQERCTSMGRRNGGSSSWAVSDISLF
jgi:hypothetical protein